MYVFDVRVMSRALANDVELPVACRQLADKSDKSAGDDDKSFVGQSNEAAFCFRAAAATTAAKRKPEAN